MQNLTTAKPLVRRLGMAGREKAAYRQPVYVLNGKLVAHASKRLFAVTVEDGETVSIDLLAKPVATLDFTSRFDKSEGLAASLAKIGAVAFRPKAAKAAAKPKASKAKASQPKAAATPSATLTDIIAAIMASDADDAAKNAALAALVKG